MHNLHLLLQRLADAQFEFVVIGGYAGVLHGSSYITDDLDICAVLSPENVARLRAVLADLNPVQSTMRRTLSILDVRPAGMPPVNLYLETDADILDAHSNVIGIGDYAQLRKSAEVISFFGRQCPVISLEDLITAKDAVGREKDLLAAKELRAIAAKRALGGTQRGD